MSTTRPIAIGWAVAMTLASVVGGCNLTVRGSVPGPSDPDAPTEFTTTESGLQYRVLRQGTGKVPKPQSFVTVDYVGTLESGRQFDSSYERSESTKFNLSGVIAGWTEGLQLVSEGGMIELVIPPELGYGVLGSPGAIPPNATLNFIVELRDVRGG